MKRRSGSAWLLVILLGLPGCVTGAGKSSFQVTIPQLQAPPRTIPCQIKGEATTCTVVATKDWQAVVIELKAACLAAGQPAAECQITQ